MTEPGTTGSAAPGRLRAALASGRFVVTAEIGPPRGADPDAITRKAELLRDWVDAANVTDNQGANVRLSSLAGSILAQRAGVEPVMQLTCRDRNRIALQSDLLGAAAIGIPNVLLLTGDHPSAGDHPEAKPVFDLDGVQLTWAARTLRDGGTLISGRSLGARPGWLIGTVENPFAPPAGFRARRLAKKVSAGAEFVQTQYVFDPDRFERWMAEVRDLGIVERCGVIAGVGPIRSLRVLEFLRSGVPGVYVPDGVARRLRGVPAGRVAQEGIDLCVETIQQLTTIPGVAGVHVMAFGYERGVPEIIQRSGVGPGVSVPAATTAREGSGHAS
jgi:methylenetetrahydrofolate reductase (NADPH)